MFEGIVLLSYGAIVAGLSIGALGVLFVFGFEQGVMREQRRNLRQIQKEQRP